MKVRVKARGAPYLTIKKGEVGEVVARRHIGTTYETIRVRFSSGREVGFYPDEVEELGDD